jgi:hypothetical protein
MRTDTRYPQIHRKGRRWTWRLWWLRAAAAAIDLARVTRQLGHRVEALEQLQAARLDRLRAARAPNQPIHPRKRRAA